MAVFLFTIKKGNKHSNIILGVWFLSFAVIMSCYFSLSIGVWRYFINYHKLIFIASQLSLLIGPLLYFYTKSLLDQNFRFRRIDLSHLLPFITVVCYIIVGLIFIEHFAIWRHPLDVFSNGAFLTQISVYYILILNLLKSHGTSIKTFFSNKRDLKYNWIRLLLIGSLVICIAKVQSILILFLPEIPNWCSYTATVYFLSLFLFLTLVVYVSLKIPDLHLFRKKYLNSVLSETDKLKLKNKLLEYIGKEKPYLNPDLKLDILAQNLSIPAKYLSQIINEMFHQNFYDFINQYRVKECINSLKDENNSRTTLLSIAFECGFNTKATFNSAFKKFTGVTPTEFRKNNNLNNNFNIE